MYQDPIDNSGKPFEPETPEAFFQRGEEAFQIWWSELDQAASSDRPHLDYTTAQAVWAAAYDHQAVCIMLLYDGADTYAEGAHSTGEMQLACVVDRHHNGSINFSRDDFTEWAARHEDHIRSAYSEAERPADADQLTIWIDYAEQSPATSARIKRPPPPSLQELKASADEEFVRWWTQLDPPGEMALMRLDRNEAQVVWREAYIRLREEIEVVYDNAKAFMEVVAETAQLELAYIVDRFHNGKLSFTVTDVIKYWNEDEYVLERNRTEQMISLRVVRKSGRTPGDSAL